MASFAQITVSSPSSTASSPAKFAATAKSEHGVSITEFQIYIDSSQKYRTSSGTVSTSLSLSSGKHNVVFQAWDSKGYVYRKQLYVTISTGTASSDTSSTSKSYTNIDQMSGWESCDACAGSGGSGPSAPYSLSQYISSPSMDGKSAKFSLGGSTPYSQALWWKHLTAQSGAHHFLYDLYFYITNSSAPQALEFDVNQSANGHHFIFGTQCDIRKSKQWDVWDDMYKKFIPTGIACSAPSAYKWHHLILEFYRSTDNRTHFIAVTLDGAKHYISKSYATHSTSASSLSTAFQMDGNYQETDYSTWLDKVKLTYW